MNWNLTFAEQVHGERNEQGQPQMYTITKDDIMDYTKQLIKRGAQYVCANITRTYNPGERLFDMVCEKTKPTKFWRMSLTWETRHTFIQTKTKTRYWIMPKGKLQGTISPKIEAAYDSIINRRFTLQELIQDELLPGTFMEQGIITPNANERRIILRAMKEEFRDWEGRGQLFKGGAHAQLTQAYQHTKIAAAIHMMSQSFAEEYECCDPTELRERFSTWSYNKINPKVAASRAGLNPHYWVLLPEHFPHDLQEDFEMQNDTGSP